MIKIIQITRYGLRFKVYYSKEGLLYHVFIPFDEMMFWEPGDVISESLIEKYKEKDL